MSVAIIGGNECMIRRYAELCSDYKCKLYHLSTLSVSGNIFETDSYKVAELSTSNEVIASESQVLAAIENGTVETLRLKSAIKAAIIFTCAALTVFVMSYLKFPVSANQSITGAIIGWGLFYADYKDPEILAINLPQIGKFASTWILNPLGAGIISFILIFLFHIILFLSVSLISSIF